MRVLIAVDASDHGVIVAQTARALFGAAADYVVVSVAPLSSPSDWSSCWGVATPMTAPLTIAEYADEAPNTTVVGLLAHRAERHAAEISVRSPLGAAEPVGDAGDPASCILSAAHEHRADVVVIGYHDRSWFSRLLAPSVSRDVLRRSDVPVLVVRE